LSLAVAQELDERGVLVEVRLQLDEADADSVSQPGLVEVRLDVVDAALAHACWTGEGSRFFHPGTALRSAGWPS
jgi:hypothetical protein